MIKELQTLLIQSEIMKLITLKLIIIFSHQHKLDHMLKYLYKCNHYYSANFVTKSFSEDKTVIKMKDPLGEKI